MISVSVVVPFYNGESTLAACFDALLTQNLPRGSYEVIAVDDGSTDRSGDLASRSGVTLVRQENRGAPAARNAGIRAARGEWVAFTDADCMPSRGWLRALLTAVTAREKPALGAAGPIIGQPAASPASRYVDISGGLDAERHLSHPRYPFAPSGNVMYRRSALALVGGFDERFAAYDACDLHGRLSKAMEGEMVFAREAVVFHRNRDTWSGYWKQQVNYGRGLAQFYFKKSGEIPWSPFRELREWMSLVPPAALACIPGSDDVVLARRGMLVKRLAQRVGFSRTYFSSSERSRWTGEWTPA